MPAARRPCQPAGRPPSRRPAGRRACASRTSHRTSLASLISLKRCSAAGALVDVGMVLARELAEGLLDVGLAGRPRHAEGGVVVLVLHRRIRGRGRAVTARPLRVLSRPRCGATTAGGCSAGGNDGRMTLADGHDLADRRAVGVVGRASGLGRRRSAASRTWSMESTRTSFICLRISSGMSRRSFSFLRGRMTIAAPERCAARILLFRPPMGRTRPRRVISPVMATSLRTGMPVKALTMAVAIVMPADGPSLGMAPAGTWMWSVFFSKVSSVSPAPRRGPGSTTGRLVPTRASPRPAGR